MLQIHYHEESFKFSFLVSFLDSFQLFPIGSCPSGGSVSLTHRENDHFGAPFVELNPAPNPCVCLVGLTHKHKMDLNITVV